MGADASALMVASRIDAATGETLDFAQFEALVGPSEFFSQSRATFDALDANHDGRVTREEVEQWLQQQLGEDEARSRAAELTGMWATRGGAYRGKAADEPVSFADFFLFVSQSARSLPVLHALGRTGGRAVHGLPVMSDRTIGELAGFKVNFGDVWGRYGTGLYETPGGRPRAEGSADGTTRGTGGAGAASAQTASSHGRATVLRHMVAGAVAGTLAKTAIAPCDRVKIIFQVSERPFSLRAAVRHGADIVRNEGVLRLWKGHSAMVARVLPYASIHFAAHEQLNASLAPKPGERLPIGTHHSRSYDQHLSFLPMSACLLCNHVCILVRCVVISNRSLSSLQWLTGRKFVSGAAAGAASTVCTYPLDLLRARMAVEDGQISFRNLVSKVLGEGGVGALFRGVGPTLTGIVPYSGTAWLVKETVGENLPLLTGRQLSTTDRVLCGTLIHLHLYKLSERVCHLCSSQNCLFASMPWLIVLLCKVDEPRRSPAS